MSSTNNKTECPRHVIELTDSVSMAFRLIPPDEFLMGSRGYTANEEPIHRVVVKKDFWMGETPVTQEQFAVWTTDKKVKHKNHFDGRPHNPAESMSWNEASEFCDWLTKRYLNDLPADPALREYRFAELPCEAYWEYACRAGTTTEYHTGDGVVALTEAGHFGGDWEKGSTHPIGEKRPPNSFGLLDTHGNVWEWCLDRWDDSAYRRRWDRITARQAYLLSDQFGDRSEDPYRVLRGGSWYLTANWCRSAVRNWGRAGYRGRNVGCRVCLVRSPFSGQPVAERES